MTKVWVEVSFYVTESEGLEAYKVSINMLAPGYSSESAWEKSYFPTYEKALELGLMTALNLVKSIDLLDENKEG